MSQITRNLAAIIILCIGFFSVNAAPPPVINATADSLSGCEGLHVTFTNTTVATTHYWDFGPGNGNSSLQSPSVIFLNPGTHVVTYTATDATGSSQKTWNIVVHPTPVVNFTASPTTLCEGSQVQFTDASIPGGTGTNSYSWVIGGNGSTAKNPTHTFSNCGNYDITLELTNQYGCKATVVKPNMITVHCNPTVTFVATPSTHCLQTGIVNYASNFGSTISNGAQPYTYAWDFTGATPANSTVANPTAVTYTTSVPASYNVKLKVTDANGCVGELQKPNYIKVEDLVPNFTVAPTTTCVFTPVTVTNTSTSTIPGTLFTSWDWGDNSGNTLGTPATHVYATPGTKTITLTTSVGACQKTFTRQVVIQPQPIIDFSFTPEKPCPAPQLINFTATGATNYTWDFGDPPGGTGTNPSHMYANNGFYSVTLIGTDNNGCKDTVTHKDTVRIYDAYLEIIPDTPGGCVNDTVFFSYRLRTSIPGPDTVNYPYNITSFEWDFGDGSSISTQPKPYHIYKKIQTSSVKLKIITENGCIFRDTIEVIHDTLPDVGFFIVPTHICNRKNVFGYDTSKKYPTDTSKTVINAWKWKVIPVGGLPAQTLTSDDQNPTFFIEYPDIYTVIFYAAKYYCWDSVKVDSMIIVDVPRADFDFTVSCDTPTKVRFNNKSYGEFGVTNPSFKWFFGDPANTTSTDTHPTFTYPALGNYTARLIAYNDTIHCSDTIDVPVVLQIPSLAFKASDTTICPTETITLTGQVTNGYIKEYTWFVDNALASFTQSFSQKFNTKGFHTVTMITRDVNNCMDTLTKQDYIVVSTPTVDFTNPVIVCQPNLVNFTDNSTRFPNTPLADLSTRTWYFGNATATTTNTSISNYYPTTGHFDVKLVITDVNGCKDSITKFEQVNVYRPVAKFDADDLNPCIGQEVSFYNKSDSAVSGYWEFGDGGFSNDFNGKHSYTKTGTYNVTLVVTDKHGCKDTLVKPAYIKIIKPAASFTMSDSFSICHPHKVQFKSTSGPVRGTLKHWWDFGTGTTLSNILDPLHTYQLPGYYTVNLVVTDQTGCTDTATGHVNILGYAGAIQYSPLFGCKPLTVNFTANTTNIPSVVWDFNDGNTLVGNASTTVSHTYTIPGAYIPKIIFSDGKGCKSTSEGLDTIKVDGILPGFIHTPACEGYTLQFEDTSKGMFGAIKTWEWTFDNGQASTVKKPYHFYPAVGTYPVTLIVTNVNGCKDSITRQITIHPLPEIGAGADTIICLKDFAQLQGTGGVSYVWTPDATLSCGNCPDPKASPEKKTEYTVIGTDVNGCSDTDRVIIDIQLKTTSIVGEGGEICDEETIQLHASGAQTYVWTPASDVNDNKLADPLASPHQTTNFMVVATEGSCIPDTGFVKVVVHPKPTVKASGEATIIGGQSTPIDASGNLIKRFEWTPGESLTCSDCPSPYAAPTRKTTYTIIAYSEYECTDSAKVTIKVLCDESQLFIPNTFTPNGDGMNDVFYPRGDGLDKVITFRIYNRWGEIVYDLSNFNLNDKQGGWDGTYKGAPLPPDVFVYIIEARCDNDDILKLKGDITLIR